MGVRNSDYPFPLNPPPLLLLLLLRPLLRLGLLPMRLLLLGLGIHDGEYPFPLSPPPLLLLLLHRLGPRLLLVVLLLLGLGLSIANGDAHELPVAALLPVADLCPGPGHHGACQVMTWPGH